MARAVLASYPALQQWPSRVAIVPYGKSKNYGTAPAMLLIDDGISTQLGVFSPSELTTWASRQSPRKVWASYDILSCLPCEVAPADCGSTGLGSAACWSAVHTQRLFKRLLEDMVKHPCDLVLSGAQLHGERSVVYLVDCVVDCFEYKNCIGPGSPATLAPTGHRQWH